MLDFIHYDFQNIGLVGLFLVCFLSATILPLSSEGVLLYFLSIETFNPIFLLLIASFGNSLGGLTNYLLGFYGNKYFVNKINSRGKVFLFSEKYGSYVAFFSWIPFIGDPLLVALGFLKSNFLKTISFMIIGKVLRYIPIIYYFL